MIAVAIKYAKHTENRAGKKKEKNESINKSSYNLILWQSWSWCFLGTGAH